MRLPSRSRFVLFFSLRAPGADECGQISLFEDLVDNTIEDTKSIPTDIATSGKVKMSRRDIMKHIGELFILRININLQGSVLDSPELMWAVCTLISVVRSLLTCTGTATGTRLPGGQKLPRD